MTGNSLPPFALVTWGGGGKPKIVTNGDKGGRGVKKSHFCGDVILNGPILKGIRINLNNVIKCIFNVTTQFRKRKRTE